MYEQLDFFPVVHAFKDSIYNDLKDFSEFRNVTHTEENNGVTYFTNEFWTSRQRQAHRVHEISYRACFKPQLPAFFINRLSKRGDIIYDPFMGRGTTPIEAALHGRTPYGNDTNPLSRALTEPRINPPDLGQVQKRLAEIPWKNFTSLAREDLQVFYHPDVLTNIEGLRAWFLDKEKSGLLDQIDKWIRMVALNRLTGHSAGFFSVYTLPPNQAVSIERQKAINEKRNQTPPYRSVAKIIRKKSQSLLSQGSPVASKSLFLTGPSSNTPEIESETVTLTVTSPPFLDIVNYEADNWLRCWFLGIDPASVKISSHRTVESWQAFIRKTLKELARITKPDGHIAFEVGEVRNGTVNLEEYVIAASHGLPLKTVCVMINQQDFTKTSNCWGISNNASGTNSNRIVIFQKVA